MRHAASAASAASAAALLLCALAPGQGTFTILGRSCAGSGRFTAPSANAHRTQIGATVQQSFNTALGVPVRSYPMIVFGFDLFTKTVAPTKTLTIATQLYFGNAAGEPAGPPVATATMTVGARAKWCTTRFAAPLPIPANRKLFLSYTEVPGRMLFPIMAGGRHHECFIRRLPSSPTWSGPHFVQPWGWRLRSAAATTFVDLSNRGVPSLGRDFDVDLTGARPGAPAVLLLGRSSIAWGRVLLPLDLTLLNAPGCWLLVSGELLVPVRANARGFASVGFAIPRNPTLAGLQFFTQYVVDDPGVNGLGAVTTNAGTWLIR